MSKKTTEDKYAEVSLELNLFRERRVAERRTQQRATPDRRQIKALTYDSSSAQSVNLKLH